MRSALHRIGLVLAIAVVAAAVAVPALARQHRQSANVSRKVYASEFKFRLPLKFAHRGIVTFMVVNKGKLQHDFKIAGHKTKLINPGRKAVVKVKFAKKGKYKYVCTVPGHAAAGMHGIFTIK